MLFKLQIIPLALFFGIGGAIYTRAPWRWWLGPLLLPALACAPFIYWQSTHGWPMREFAASLRSDGDDLWVFLIMQPLALGVVGMGLLALGILRGWQDPRFRPLTLAVLGLAILYAAMSAKFYYLFPALVPMAALGVQSIVRPKPWFAAFSLVLVVVLVVFGPILPARILSKSPFWGINPTQAERIGWSHWVERVDSASKEHGLTSVLVANYGEAGALRFLTKRRYEVWCGHNQHAFWSPSRLPNRMLTVGYSAKYLRRYYQRVVPIGKIDSTDGVQNEETGQALCLVEILRSEAEQTWKLAHFD